LVFKLSFFRHGYPVNGSGADCKSAAYGSVGSTPTPCKVLEGEYLMTKKWIEDYYGRPGYSKRKIKGEEPLTFPSTYGDHQGEVEVLQLLKIIEQAEIRYGEIKDVMLHMDFSPEQGHGEDREGAYVTYWIKFKRLETESEKKSREERERKDKEVTNEKETKEKEVLKRLLKKYPDVKKL
jgi:hypothetical protein